MSSRRSSPSSTTARSTGSAEFPAVHALWTLHGLGVLDGTPRRSAGKQRGALEARPAHSHRPPVRKAALSVLPATQQSIAAALSAGALTDKDLNVRLNALLAFSRMPASVEAGREIYRASKDQAVMEDEWLPEAVWIAATRHEEGFLKAYADEVGVPEVMKIAVRGARGERGGGVDWSAPSLPDADWKVVPAPKVWSETAIGDHVGTIWLRRTTTCRERRRQPAEIRLGIVDDSDVTYVNGVRIGATVTSRNLPRHAASPRCPDRRVERDRRAHLERQRPWRVRARSGAGARCVAAGEGIRADRHGHRRRRLHHPPRR